MVIEKTEITIIHVKVFYTHFINIQEVFSFLDI